MKAYLTKPMVFIPIACVLLATSVLFWGNDAIAELLTKDLFSNSKVIWEKEFDGKLQEVQVGGGNVVVWDRHHLKYLDSMGNVCWEKRFDENSICKVSLSQNGDAIIVNVTDWVSDRSKAHSYDRSGRLKWDVVVWNPGLTLSPKSNYAITTHRSIDEDKGYFRVFDNQTGKELWNDHAGRWFAAFLTDSEVVYLRSPVIPKGTERCELSLLELKGFTFKWTRDLQKEIDSVDPVWVGYGADKLRTDDDGKLISLAVFNFNYKGKGHPQERALLVFNRDGDFLWKRNDFAKLNSTLGGIDGFAFTADSEYLIVESFKGTFDLLDPLTGQRLWRAKQEDFRGRYIDHTFFFGERCFLPVIKWVRGEDAKELILIFDEKTGEQIGSPVETVTSMISMGDKYLIIMNEDKNRIQKVQID